MDCIQSYWYLKTSRVLTVCSSVFSLIYNKSDIVSEAQRLKCSVYPSSWKLSDGVIYLVPHSEAKTDLFPPNNLSESNTELLWQVFTAQANTPDLENGISCYLDTCAFSNPVHRKVSGESGMRGGNGQGSQSHWGYVSCLWLLEFDSERTGRSGIKLKSNSSTGCTGWLYLYCCCMLLILECGKLLFSKWLSERLALLSQLTPNLG